MNVLDFIPILGTAFGAMLFIFILFRTSGLGKDRRLRYVIASIVLLYTWTSLDILLVLETKGYFDYVGLSYLFFHWTGFLLYYFIALFTKTSINIPKWLMIIGIYTFVRWGMIAAMYEDYTSYDYEDSDVYTEDIIMLVEYVMAHVVNIVFSIFALIKLQNVRTALSLEDKQVIHFKWIKIVLGAFIILQLGAFVNESIGLFDFENFLFYLKVESVAIGIIFFVFTYSIIHFPVFAITGDFEDLPKVEKTKYAKSSLKTSDVLFQQIKQLVSDEELYLDYNVKLNTIAERLDKSVHHISQAINQNAEMGFHDFINQFRIEKAKEKLLEPNPDTIFAISLDVGFNSKASFYTAFKKFTDQTPSEFKKNGASH